MPNLRRWNMNKVVAVALLAGTAASACQSTQPVPAASPPSAAPAASAPAPKHQTERPPKVALATLPRPVAKPAPPQPQAQPSAVAPASPPAAVAAPIAPAVARPPLQVRELIGLDRDRVTRLFGVPEAMREAAPATVWDFSGGPDCRLSVFFYPDVKTREFRALSVEVTTPEESPVADSACLERLRGDRPGL